MWGEASTSPIPVIAESVWTFITTVSCAPSLAAAETFGIRSGTASIFVIFMVSVASQLCHDSLRRRARPDFDRLDHPTETDGWLPNNPADQSRFAARAGHCRRRRTSTLPPRA